MLLMLMVGVCVGTCVCVLVRVLCRYLYCGGVLLLRRSRTQQEAPHADQSVRRPIRTKHPPASRVVCRRWQRTPSDRSEGLTLQARRYGAVDACHYPLRLQWLLGAFIVEVCSYVLEAGH